MISLGRTISAIFFLGIGSILNLVGAFGTVLGFFLGGLIMMLVMISLAEMSIEMPISGSFQAYATKLTLCLNFLVFYSRRYKLLLHIII